MSNIHFIRSGYRSLGYPIGESESILNNESNAIEETVSISVAEMNDLITFAREFASSISILNDYDFMNRILTHPLYSTYGIREILLANFEAEGLDVN